MLSYQLNQPFDRFIKEGVVVFGREEANNLELLTDVILAHWKPLELDYKNLILREDNKFLTQTQAGFAYYY